MIVPDLRTGNEHGLTIIIILEKILKYVDVWINHNNTPIVNLVHVYKSCAINKSIRLIGESYD